MVTRQEIIPSKSDTGMTKMGGIAAFSAFKSGLQNYLSTLAYAGN